MAPLRPVTAPRHVNRARRDRNRPISSEARRAYRVYRDDFPRLPGLPNASPARPVNTRWPTRRLATDVLPERSRGKTKACTRVRISRQVSLVKDSSSQTRSHRVVRRRVRIVRRVAIRRRCVTMHRVRFSVQALAKMDVPVAALYFSAESKIAATAVYMFDRYRRRETSRSCFGGALHATTTRQGRDRHKVAYGCVED